MKGVLTKVTELSGQWEFARQRRFGGGSLNRSAKVSKRSLFESLSADYSVHCKSQMARRRDAIEARLRNPGRRFNSGLGTADSVNQLFWQA